MWLGKIKNSFFSNTLQCLTSGNWLKRKIKLVYLTQELGPGSSIKVVNKCKLDTCIWCIQLINKTSPNDFCTDLWWSLGSVLISAGTIFFLSATQGHAVIDSQSSWSAWEDLSRNSDFWFRKLPNYLIHCFNTRSSSGLNTEESENHVAGKIV